MRVTIKQTGTDVDDIVTRQIREMLNASKKAGRDVAKVGVKAFKSSAGVSHFAGYPLKFKAKKISAGVQESTISFQASPVGFWVMVEDGARPHPIRPRKGKVLRLGTDTFYAKVNHPGMSGNGAYSRGEAGAIKALDKVIVDAYEKAFD